MTRFDFEERKVVDVWVKQIETGYICTDKGRRQTYGTDKQEAIGLFKKEFKVKINLKE